MEKEGRKMDENSPIIFFQTFESRYIICETCFQKLKEDGSLTSIDGKCTVEITNRIYRT